MLHSAENGPLSPGSQVGQYKVIVQLGSGTYGDVYKVLDTDLGVPRALKVLKRSAGSHRVRLLREGRAMAKVEHPNVVRVIHTIDDGDVTGLVLEFIAGRSLAEMLDELDPTLLDPTSTAARAMIDLGEARRLGRGIISGVCAAHRGGFLHRDLKPENVLLATGPDGRRVPKVVDFGLAKELLTTSSGGSHTLPGTALGTPFYMSPEQWRNAKTVDERTDVWSLGALLYQLITGQVPFPGVTAVEVADRIRIGRYEDPAAVRPSLPRGMADAIRGALVVDRHRRIADCQALLETWTRTGQERTVVQVGPPSEQSTLLTSARDAQPTVVVSPRGHAAPPPVAPVPEPPFAALTLLVAGTIGVLSGMGFVVGYLLILAYRTLQGTFG